MKKLFLILALISLSGCATIFSGTTQNVNIKIEDNVTKEALTGVTCLVTDSHGGQHSLNSNPSVITVTRGNGPLTVSCQKPGYRQINTLVGDSFNGTTLVNILFWPGFLVDGVSGAYKKYPAYYVVNMESNTVAAAK